MNDSNSDVLSTMEQRFFFGLLMWGEENLTPDYIVFCFVASLGALQFVAGKYERRDLTPLPSRLAQAFGALLVLLAFLWFFTVRSDLFIPGLAGGEFVVYSFVTFVAAVLVSKTVARIALRVVGQSEGVTERGKRVAQED